MRLLFKWESWVPSVSGHWKNLTFKNDSCFAVVVPHDFLFIGIFSLNILTVNLTSCHFWQMTLFPWVISFFQQIVLVTISYYVEYPLLTLIMQNLLIDNSQKESYWTKLTGPKAFTQKETNSFSLIRTLAQPMK